MQNLVNTISGPGAEAEKQGARHRFPTVLQRWCCAKFLLTINVPCLPRAAAMAKLEDMQVKDTLRMINNMVELCFSECVTSFRQKALATPEEKCINTCAEKFLKHSGRVGQRFGELWMAEQQAQQQGGADGAGGPS
jgi:import inner membrane translocase subunit TIM9